MSNTRRGSRLAGAAMAVFLLATTAACGTGPGDSSKVLRVQVPPGKTADAFKKVATDFEKANPGVSVQLEAIDSAAQRGPNAALLSSSSAPDVGFLQRGTGVWSTLINNNELSDLGDVWSNNKLPSVLEPALVQKYTTGDKHFGVPYDQLLIAPVYYNIDAFKKAGIKEPDNHQVSSVSELESIATKLKASGVGGLGVGGASTYHLGHTFDSILPTAVNSSTYDQLTTNFKPGSSTQVKLTDPGFVSALQFLKTLQDNGVYQDGMLGMDDQKATALFEAGSIGMVQGGSYSWSDIEAAKPKFQVGWFMLPSLTPGKLTPMGSYVGDTYVVPKKAANAELGKKFLEFFLTDEYQKTVVPATGGLPIFTTVKPEEVTGIGQPVREMLAHVKESGVVNPWDTEVPPTLGQTFYVPLLQQLVGGKLTAEEVAAKMQRALEDLQSGKVSSATD